MKSPAPRGQGLLPSWLVAFAEPSPRTVGGMRQRVANRPALARSDPPARRAVRALDAQTKLAMQEFLLLVCKGRGTILM